MPGVTWFGPHAAHGTQPPQHRGRHYQGLRGAGPGHSRGYAPRSHRARGLAAAGEPVARPGQRAEARSGAPARIAAVRELAQAAHAAAGLSADLTRGGGLGPARRPGEALHEGHGPRGAHGAAFRRHAHVAVHDGQETADGTPQSAAAIAAGRRRSVSADATTFRRRAASFEARNDA